MEELTRYITIDAGEQELEYLVEYWAPVKYDDNYMISSEGRTKNIEREGLSLCGLKVTECCELAPRTPLL